ncbi:hypothetical protein BABINDRAFT_8293 [Babjeviella inositovora NRRL Y-12698]|uniref:CAAX prenyl protease n=1 Tax=Babjeviella inositovora NRRL Y-12698 TaxID=984486 RepID=A0A1E3QPG1_9ASCO|nr:uncharacterized protein BABINDRAFT_8293 [Babjeviella inositovora NRRL Y-12698]ODQ79344.1 hypothetical protein BABINDRAFT_8293 [Babjeviella inositovora NRRL Y-12698]
MILTNLQALATLLDDPDYNWKTIIIGFATAQFAFENYLTVRQLGVLTKDQPPQTLRADISQETFEKSQAYSRAKAKFSIFNSVYSYIQNYLFITYNAMPVMWFFSGELLRALSPVLPASFSGEISQSVVFFTVFSIFGSVVSLPLSYFQNFVLEEKYGFNKLTVGLWLSDAVKGLALSFVLGSPLLAGFLKIIQYFGDRFIFYVWVFIFVVQVVMIAIYPTVIQPMFNKLTPLAPGALKDSIEKLALKNKFPLSKLYVIDGSKRSSHSNAYFYGMPWSKQIVIFDTLIETSTVSETTAVLAHEIGHWALSHTTQMLVIAQLHLLFMLTLFSIFIHNQSLYVSFGFLSQTPILIGFLLFNDILQPLDCVISFLMNVLSRKNEYEADAYAVKLDYATDLARALIKLQIENLSSMEADWLYSAYHYSHPLLSERLKAIGYVAKEKVKKEE